MAEKSEEIEIMAMLDKARYIKNYVGNPRKAIKICDKI